MDYLQYIVQGHMGATWKLGFKPYYKWITFNTLICSFVDYLDVKGFKPYYKWITFNTNELEGIAIILNTVLNLIINGLPSIHILK